MHPYMVHTPHFQVHSHFFFLVFLILSRVSVVAEGGWCPSWSRRLLHFGLFAAAGVLANQTWPARFTGMEKLSQSANQPNQPNPIGCANDSYCLAELKNRWKYLGLRQKKPDSRNKAPTNKSRLTEIFQRWPACLCKRENLSETVRHLTCAKRREWRNDPVIHNNYQS